ncbi:dipeptide ABC transporter ATP-binding protein [Microbacterium sp. zg-YB36]|uniref:dipeptide ABC transporter ATP-binding protein n=1 Tax=Microbacterium sp. zg-YB36 TaxID=2969407 RepID=UPI00214CF53B|nr:dipeptide ABC transporter ATP-binding protein [Microbacterium sp. zg-YB36]MDL5350760.1 dipeptide ABC transporter ATP-binding protein [Microbacterium sp. zg-YB36]
MTATPAEVVAPADAPPARDTRTVVPLWRQLLARPVFATCTAIILILVALVALAPIIAPYPPLEQDLTATLQGPSAAHLLGTDDLGRDVLSRLLHGGRVTMLGVLQALVVFLLVGTGLGLVAGMGRGWVDTAIVRAAEILMSLPAFIILLVTLSIAPGNMTLAMVTIGVLTSPLLMRVVRGTTKSVRGELFVRAARIMGLSETQITLRHVLPRLAGPIIVQLTIFSGAVILTETGLGYLGFGVRLPHPSWGNMVQTASENITRAPWLLIPTGGVIIVTILSLMLIGDGIRDAVADRWTGAAVRRRRPRPAAPAAMTVGAAQDDAVIVVDGLTIVADHATGEVPIVEGVSFRILPGETVALVGESGSGKSVTALAVLGLTRGLRKTSGRVLVNGADIGALSPEALRQLRSNTFGYITQDPQPSLDPSMRVGDLLAQLVRLHQGVDVAQSRRISLELLERVRIPDAAMVARRYPHQLSGGMAQRVVIAAALSARPRILIADEPTTALDVTVQAEILALLHDLCDADDSMALLLITHDWGVVADIADRIVVLHDGQLIESGDAARVFTEPEHPHTRAMLAADPAHLEVRGPRPPAPALLRIEGLEIAYNSKDAAGRPVRTTAVNGLDLTVRAGRTLGLIGESGSGKTSVGNAVVSLVTPSAGSIRLRDEELVGTGRARRRELATKVQMIFQDPYGSLNPVRTVGSTLAEPLILAHGMSRVTAERAVREALERVGLPAAAASRYPAQFSGGQRQRIAIARAVVLRPDLIVCDEPVSALDLSIQAQVLELLQELQDDLGMAYLFISHDLSVVRSFCDEVAVMYRGEVVERGATAEVVARPAHPYTRSLLDAAPVPDPSVQRGRSVSVQRWVP